MKDVKYVSWDGYNSNGNFDLTETKYYDETGKKITLIAKENRYIDNKKLFRTEYTYNTPEKNGTITTMYDDEEKVSSVTSKYCDANGKIQIDTDALLGEQETIDAKYIMDNYKGWWCSLRSGLDDLNKILYESLDSLILTGTKYEYDAVKIFDCLIKCINNLPEVKDTVTDPSKLSKATIEKLNENDILGTIKTILNSSELKDMYYLDVNGEIEDFAQGGAQDCWLLSGLKMLSNSEKGRQYIKDAIQEVVDENGQKKFIVTFKEYSDDGKNIYPEFTTEITQDEISKARKTMNYSHGDIDVLVVELAMEKSKIEREKNKDPNSEYYESITKTPGKALDFGGPIYILGPLIGLDLFRPEFAGFPPEYLFNRFYDDFKNGDANFAFSSDKILGVVKDKQGNNFPDVPNHSYAITDINKDERTVTLTNPWNSDKPIVLSWEDFTKVINTENAGLLECYFLNKNSINVDDVFEPFINGELSEEKLRMAFMNLVSQGVFSDEQKQYIITKAEELNNTKDTDGNSPYRIDVEVLKAILKVDNDDISSEDDTNKFIDDIFNEYIENPNQSTANDLYGKFDRLSSQGSLTDEQKQYIIARAEELNNTEIDGNYPYYINISLLKMFLGVDTDF